MKSIKIILLILLMQAPAFADVLKLTSGEIVEGKIIDISDEHIKLDYGEGIKITYYSDEISQVNGKDFHFAYGIENDSHSYLFDKKFVNWLNSNVSLSTKLPLSFSVTEENRPGIYKKINQPNTVPGIIERMIVEEGISIYDAALWQIILTIEGGEKNFRKAYLPLKFYWEGHLGGLVNIRAGFPDQPFVYDPDDPKMVSSNLEDRGKRGFIFRILNANGRYSTKDPLDGKTRFPGFPNWPTVHWEDWKPIAGENAWVVLAALQLYHAKYFNKEQGYQNLENAIEVKLAEEIARAAILLQADNGGIRMAPLGTYHGLQDIDYHLNYAEVEKKMGDFFKERPIFYAGRLTGPTGTSEIYNSDENTWHYNEISTENNISWYAAFNMLYKITKNDIYKKARSRIEEYFKSVWNKEENVFYQGAHYDNNKWNVNTKYFATDVQDWSVMVLGPDKIDKWFGEGSAYRMWEATKDYSGARINGGEQFGVGYTKENNRISIEWTVGAIFATRELYDFYKASHPDWAKEAYDDSVKMRKCVESFRVDVSKDKAAYPYSTRRGWIPFGWFSHDKDILSLTSTCWVMLADIDFNPFFLPSK